MEPQNSLDSQLPPPTTSENNEVFKSTDCFLALGRRGCGKSTLAKRLQSAYPRRVIIDSLHEYEIEGAEIARSFDEFCFKMQQIAQSHRENWVLIFKVRHDDPNSVEIVNHAVRIAFEMGDCMIVIEEIQLFSSHHNLPNYLKNALLLGRHHNIALFFTSQRAGEIHKTILSQCNHIFVGQMHEKNDINYLKSFLGSSVDQLPNFPVHNFLHFAQSGKITRVVNRI